VSRYDFTIALLSLLARMVAEGERPIMDYVKRSDEEQNRLYAQGLSKCDGLLKVSAHQVGRAADIYFLAPDDSELVPPVKGHTYWHEHWERLGGKPMLDWDRGHYELRS
jgi:hypothetical protein